MSAGDTNFHFSVFLSCSSLGRPSTRRFEGMCTLRSPEKFVYMGDVASEMVIRDLGRLIVESRPVGSMSRNSCLLTEPNKSDSLDGADRANRWHRLADQFGADFTEGFAHFPSSNLAIASVCTSSGPSARRKVRTPAQAPARNVSCETPAPPCA